MAASPTVAPIDIAGKLPFTKTRASVLLDAIRGIAAVCVTLGHLWYRLCFAVPDHPHHPLVWKAALLMTELGHPAVIVFFVLSGFLVGGSLLRAYGNGTWSWADYLTHRLVRLWIVLIPALLLGLFWDTISLHVAQGRANNSLIVFTVAEVAASRTILTFFGNVAFLQTWAVPMFGSNGPLWSLRNEFWYYIMFPLGFFAVMPKYKPLLRVLSGCAMVLLMVLGPSIVVDAPLWLFGALLYYCNSPKLK